MANDFTLEPDERLVIANFRGDGAALRAKQELESLGNIDVQIDHIDYIPEAERVSEIQNTLAGDFDGLASSVYDAELDRDDSILLGATPDASGLADTSEHAGRDVILAVVVNEAQMGQVEQILKKHRAFF